MARHEMREQKQIDALLNALGNPYYALVYDRGGSHGEYRVTAESQDTPGIRVVLGYHPDRRTCYQEALEYIRGEVNQSTLEYTICDGGDTNEMYLGIVWDASNRIVAVCADTDEQTVIAQCRAALRQ
jgi:hypothetical protein